jgi:hypothetical protein
MPFADTLRIVAGQYSVVWGRVIERQKIPTLQEDRIVSRRSTELPNVIGFFKRGDCASSAIPDAEPRPWIRLGCERRALVPVNGGGKRKHEIKRLPPNDFDVQDLYHRSGTKL